MTNKDNYVLKGGVSKNRIDTESILNNLSEGSEIALDLVEGLGKSNNIELLANGYEEEINNLKQKEIYKKLEKEKKELEIERIKQEEKLLKQQQREIKKIYNALDNRRTDITKIDTGDRRSKTEFREEDNKTEPIIKKRNNTEDEKINRRAEILYGNAEYNQYWKDVNNKTKKQDIGEITNQPEIKPLPNISNPEKMFFKNGTLADMKPKALYNLIEINDEDKIQNRADILYPTVKNQNFGKILLANIDYQNNSKNIENNLSKFIRPVDGRITSDFGYRKAPTAGASTGHSGIDIGVPIGTPVKAVSDGKVIAARNGMRGYGTGVFIDHGVINGKHVISEYGHLSSYNVKIGDTVKKGQVFAKSGNTGISTGPHLHITIREDKKPVDPKKYFE